MISYFQAIIIGLLQGITELFPVSSLGHSVIVPGLLGWDNIVKAQSANESFYLAFLVGLHVATALALLWFFREDWVHIIRGFFRSLRHRRIETKDERLAKGDPRLSLEERYPDHATYVREVSAAAADAANC